MRIGVTSSQPQLGVPWLYTLRRDDAPRPRVDAGDLAQRLGGAHEASAQDVASQGVRPGAGLCLCFLLRRADGSSGCSPSLPRRRD